MGLLQKILVSLSILVVGFVLIGILIGAALPTVPFCGQKMCLCASEKEFVCNTCDYVDAKVLSGVVNVWKACDAQELVTCSSGTQATNVRVNESTCTYHANVLFVNVK